MARIWHMVISMNDTTQNDAVTAAHIYFNEQVFALPLTPADEAHIRKYQDSGLVSYPVYVGEGSDEVKTARIVWVDSAES